MVKQSSIFFHHLFYTFLGTVSIFVGEIVTWLKEAIVLFDYQVRPLNCVGVLMSANRRNSDVILHTGCPQNLRSWYWRFWLLQDRKKQGKPANNKRKTNLTYCSLSLIVSIGIRRSKFRRNGTITNSIGNLYMDVIDSVVRATPYKTCYYSICQKWLTSGFVNKCLLTTVVETFFFRNNFWNFFFFYFWNAPTTNINRIIG